MVDIKNATRDREVFRMAITLAHNVCVMKSYQYNADNDTLGAQLAECCAMAILDWIDVDVDGLLQESRSGSGT